jgi:hypothetical protein
MKNKQMTLASSGLEKYAKKTRRAQVLAEMDRVVPWAELSRCIRRRATAGRRSILS